MLGARKATKLATEYAILNANYMRARLQEEYEILYTNHNGQCAHEFIVDLRPSRRRLGAFLAQHADVSVADEQNGSRAIEQQKQRLLEP